MSALTILRSLSSAAAMTRLRANKRDTFRTGEGDDELPVKNIPALAELSPFICR
jgi:hypothetical protein